MAKYKSTYIKNIYYMLSYAFSALNQNGYENVEKEEFDHIHNLFAAVLAKGIGRQLKQGLYREYVTCRDDLTTMRGKLDIQGSIKNRLARKRLLSCEFDELSENNVLNQILKTTAKLLICHGDVDDEYKSTLKKEMMYFGGIDEINPAEIKWSQLRFQRNSSAYRILIGLCQLVLEGMLLTTESGAYKLASFLDDKRIELLYEKFILEYYRCHFPELNPNPARIEWAMDEEPDTQLLPAMISDITLTGKHGKRVLIIDAKFYSHITQSYYDVQKYRSNNLYQIFTYVKNKEAGLGSAPHRVSGLLLYAATDEQIQPQSYQMSGNEIRIDMLDLNREFAEIDQELRGIVKHFELEE